MTIKVKSIAGTPLEKRFIAGHFLRQGTGFKIDEDFKDGLLDRNIAEVLKYYAIKGYFLAPTKTLEYSKKVQGASDLSQHIANIASEDDDFSGLGVAVVSPVAGYIALQLWKESCPIEPTPFQWKRNDLREYQTIPFTPCTREQMIFNKEIERYQALLQSPCKKKDLKTYLNTWIPNQQLS